MLGLKLIHVSERGYWPQHAESLTPTQNGIRRGTKLHERLGGITERYAAYIYKAATHVSFLYWQIEWDMCPNDSIW